MMSSLAVRSAELERMDDPALSAADFQLALHNIARVNRWTLAARPTLAFLERAVGTRPSFRLLDVGCGEGDLLRAVFKWARARGIVADLIGVDRDPRSEGAARAATPEGMSIRFVTGDYAAIPGPFDCIVSNCVAHHMSEVELCRFISFMECSALRGWFINDLHRRRLAQLLYRGLASLMRVHPIVINDGLVSIARSFRGEDWWRILGKARLPHGDPRLLRAFPFRLCVERLVEGGR
jgi:SAM-dependent methyltransferase